MSTVINLDEKRSKKKCNPGQEGSLLKRPAPNADTTCVRTKGILRIFPSVMAPDCYRQSSRRYKKPMAAIKTTAAGP
jgi:hypothetical protein